MKMRGYTANEIESYLIIKHATAWNVCFNDGAEWGESYFFLDEEEARKFATYVWGEYGEKVKNVCLSEYYWDDDDLLFVNSDVEEVVK